MWPHVVKAISVGRDCGELKSMPLFSPNLLPLWKNVGQIFWLFSGKTEFGTFMCHLIIKLAMDSKPLKHCVGQYFERQTTHLQLDLACEPLIFNLFSKPPSYEEEIHILFHLTAHQVFEDGNHYCPSSQSSLWFFPNLKKALQPNSQDILDLINKHLPLNNCDWVKSIQELWTDSRVIFRKHLPNCVSYLYKELLFQKTVREPI